MLLEFTYVTPAQVWDALKLGTAPTPGVPAYGSQAPEPVQAALLRKIHAASARINSVTHRVFTPATLTRTFDAPGPGAAIGVGAQLLPSIGPTYNPFLPALPAVGGLGGTILVNDLQSISAITAFGATLAPSDYQILRYQTDDGRPDTTEILRLAGGVPVSWYYGATGAFQPWDAISVTGEFCYDLAGVPDAVVDVAEGMVVRAWTRRGRLYASEQGQGMQGYSKEPNLTMDADLREALTPYIADIGAEVPM